MSWHHGLGVHFKQVVLTLKPWESLKKKQLNLQNLFSTPEMIDEGSLNLFFRPELIGEGSLRWQHDNAAGMNTDYDICHIFSDRDDLTAPKQVLSH